MDNSITAHGLGRDSHTCCDALVTDRPSLCALSVPKALASKESKSVACGFAPYSGAYWMLARPGGPKETSRHRASLLQEG